MRVTGIVKAFGNKKYINANAIRPITDMHELYFHLMEAMFVTLAHQRGPVSASGSYLCLPSFLSDPRPASKTRSRDQHQRHQRRRLALHRLHRLQLDRRRAVRAVRTVDEPVQQLLAARAEDHAVHPRAAAHGGGRARRRNRAARQSECGAHQVRFLISLSFPSYPRLFLSLDSFSFFLCFSLCRGVRTLTVMFYEQQRAR